MSFVDGSGIDDRAMDGAPAPLRAEALSCRGMVSSVSQLASAAGLRMLEQGGNAVDAAIAAAAVLTMVEPRNGHLGGDTFIQVSLPGNDGVVALNGSGAAPFAADPEAFRARGAIPTTGLWSATVPGTVSAWAAAATRFGRLPLGDVLAPAIMHAAEGVPVTPRLHRMLTADAPAYRQDPAAAAVFLPDGGVPGVGARWRQPDLARSLSLIAQHGRDAFYHGPLTERMVAYSVAHDGLFQAADFAAHATEISTPLRLEYRGYEICEQPPVSQGIIVLIALNVLRRFDLAALGYGSAATLHLLIEALKLAFAARMRFCGDPAFVDIPVTYVLGDDFAAELAAQIDPARAMPLAVPAPVQPDTTSLCAADGQGMLVNYIHSLYSGAGVVLGDTGVLLNSRMLGFDLDPASPNCLAPGKRPMHTLNTYLVRRDGETVLAGNTPGAHWQVQTNLQLLVGLLDFDRSLPAAIAAPRFTIGDFDAWGNPTVKLESRADAATIAGLRERGHDLEIMSPWGAGGTVQLVARDPATGLLRGATEIRTPESTLLAM